MEALDELHARSDPALQLLDLVVEHELEFLKLLRLFAILVNLVLLVDNSSFTLMQIVLHLLNVVLLVLRSRNLLAQFHILLFHLRLEAFHHLFVVAIFVTDQSQLTLLLHTFVDFHGKLRLVLLFDSLDFFPGLILNRLTVLLMALDHLLNFLR